MIVLFIVISLLILWGIIRVTVWDHFFMIEYYDERDHILRIISKKIYNDYLFNSGRDVVLFNYHFNKNRWKTIKHR